jgi:hypothetical protein
MRQPKQNLGGIKSAGDTAKLKWQCPIVPRKFSTEMGILIGVEFRRPWYRPRLPDWTSEDISGILRSYEDLD